MLSTYMDAFDFFQMLPPVYGKKVHRRHPHPQPPPPPRIIFPYTVGSTIKVGSNTLTVGSNMILMTTNANRNNCENLYYGLDDS